MRASACLSRGVKSRERLLFKEPTGRFCVCQGRGCVATWCLKASGRFAHLCEACESAATKVMQLSKEVGVFEEPAARAECVLPGRQGIRRP